MAVKARAEITLSSIRDVQSVTRYYLLQSSTSAVPSKPTTNPPGGDWVTSEPTYTSGSTNSLYFVDLTVFSDGTFAYSDVSLSSSYEAAKVAYNKAENAEDIAGNANDKIDNLQIGGRNLLLNSEHFAPGTGIFSGSNSNLYTSAAALDGEGAYNASGSKYVKVTFPNLIAGKQYVFSCEVARQSGGVATPVYITIGSNNPINVGTAQAATWRSFSTIFTASESTTYALVQVYTAASSGSSGWVGHFRRFKLERGTVTTDWTPAPEDIEADISAANALAQSAKDTADGKITTFYAASTATPTATTTGDLWIKTDDGNSLWRWNGSAWVSVDNADIQSALTAAGTAKATADSKIVTFAQTSSPTATDVGDIWIDTDDSNRMYRWNGTAWVDVHDPQIAEANEKIDNLQIGGRNLLLNSEHFTPGSGIFSGSNVALYNDTTLDGAKLYYASGSRYVKVTFPNLTIGEQYAFSCEITRQSGGASTPVYITINGEEAVEVGTAKALVWTKFDVIFTATASTTYAKVQVYTAASNGNANYVAHFRHFKLERGNRATDWTPAPEDISDRLDENDARIKELVSDGANLIIGTTYPDASSDETLPRIFGQTHATRHGNTVASVAEHGFRATNNGTGYTYIVFGNSAASGLPPGMHGLVAGETYTLSADITCKQLSNNTNTTTYYLRCNYYDDHTTTGTMALNTYKNVISITKNDRGVEKSGRCEFTFTIPDNVTMCYIGFWCSSTTAAEFQAGDFIELRNLKLEKGSKATPWSSPVDWNARILSSANGKNTNTYTTKNSSGVITYPAGAVAGDQLFVAEYGSTVYTTLYRFNGTSWENTQIGGMAVTQLDAGNVVSGTMSANRIKGDTLTLGGANNVDGMLKVYDANGTLVGSFTREGLMAIAGTIGGWTIGEEDLTGEWDVGTEHWMVGLSKSYGLRFKEVPQGGDPATDWTREVQYNAGLASYSSKENSETYYGAVENYPGENGLRIYPKLIIGDHSSSEVTEISTYQIDTKKVRLTELWAHPLGYSDSFYMQQPLMIMAGVVTISTGTSEKNLTLCTVPTEYQSGYRIVPFVSRRYGSASGTPSDTGDFYYAYYNSITHNVHIKLANKLPSGTIFQFDYMIYAVPES